MGAPAAAAAETLRARAASDEDSENFSCGELMLRWEVAAAEAEPAPPFPPFPPSMLLPPAPVWP
jgi:hypothetical protein